MTSGHLCLKLTEQVSWEDFPDLAQTVASLVGGEIIQKSDCPDIRVWEINVSGYTLRIVFDDFPVMLTLESTDDRGDVALKLLYRDLQQKRCNE